MKYANIVFMQGDDADEAFAYVEALEEYPGGFPSALLDYLKQWDYGDESECDVSNTPNYGTYDDVFEDGDYVLSWSHQFGTCGLDRKITDD